MESTDKVKMDTLVGLIREGHSPTTVTELAALLSDPRHCHPNEWKRIEARVRRWDDETVQRAMAEALRRYQREAHDELGLMGDVY